MSEPGCGCQIRPCGLPFPSRNQVFGALHGDARKMIRYETFADGFQMTTGNNTFGVKEKASDNRRNRACTVVGRTNKWGLCCARSCDDSSFKSAFRVLGDLHTRFCALLFLEPVFKYCTDWRHEQSFDGQHRHILADLQTSQLRRERLREEAAPANLGRECDGNQHAKLQSIKL